MGWEERGGRRYYYRKVRKGGRVFSVYEGGGIDGEIAAAQDVVEQEKKTQTRAELQREMAAQDRIDNLIGESERIAQDAARRALEAAGFHQHKRHWRLKRSEA
jgi:transcriptional regulator with PAS, ATPase and Fis domain